MKKWAKAVVVVLILVVVFGALGGVAYYRYGEKLKLLMGKKEEQLDLATPVAVSTAKNDSITESLVLNGEVVSKMEVNIYSTVNGKIQKKMVEEGDKVKEDDVLAYVDRSEAGMTYVPTPVESTIDGIVKEVFVDLGDYITPQVPLFQIVDMEEVEVVVNVPEKYIAKIREGLFSEIALVAYPERQFYGRVKKISPALDPASRTLETRVLVQNKNYLVKPGMYGEVRIVLRKKENAIVIPISAVIERDGRNVVFIEEDGLAKQVEPVFDITEGDRISVSEGIEKEQRVIVTGQHNVSTGDKIIVTEVIE
jgi:membrane fusion protein (multidrug efflux system)